MKSPMLRRLREVNGELWLIISLFAIAMLLNYMVSMHRAVLGFYDWSEEFMGKLRLRQFAK
jgi:Ca2+/H+ antiporter